MVTINAHRREPELLAPARATPRELKYLSDIDNQRSLRYYASLVEFFRGEPADAPLRRRDPVLAIRSALAEALVYFYPVAGRLRELQPDGRLIVECTAEGVVFVEADADVSLAELGQPLLSSCSGFDELLCDLGDSKDVLGKPVCFIQVTRFNCGGFAVGVHWCHNMHDAFGICKFLKAVGDLSCRESKPLVLPVWEREILTSYTPPNVTRPLLGYETLMSADTASMGDVMQNTPPSDMTGRYFLFGPAEMSVLRSHVSGRLGQYYTDFDILAGLLWKCRTVALEYAGDHCVRLMFVSNARRGCWKRDPPIPAGYDGCAIVFIVTETTADELCTNDLTFAAQLVRQAKVQVDDRYMRSTVELLASRKWPHLVVDRTFVVSDLSPIGEDTIDFGWGKRVGGVIPMAGNIMNSLLTYFMKFKDAKGEDCFLVPVYLPKAAMGRFAEEISVWTKINPKEKY